MHIQEKQHGSKASGDFWFLDDRTAMTGRPTDRISRGNERTNGWTHARQKKEGAHVIL